jgi:hypothetical protein
VLPRALVLLVAVLAGLPVQAWARLAQACEVPDHCCCRDVEASTDAEARRVDCCAAPCDAGTVGTPAALTRGDRFVALAQAHPSFVASQTPRCDAAGVPPRPCTRGPPARLFGIVQHWLL